MSTRRSLGRRLLGRWLPIAGLTAGAWVHAADLRVQVPAADATVSPEQGKGKGHRIGPGGKLAPGRLLRTQRGPVTLAGPCGILEVQPKSELSLDACDQKAGLSVELRAGSVTVQSADGQLPAQVVTERGSARSTSGRFNVEVRAAPGAAEREVRITDERGEVALALPPPSKPPALPSVPSQQAEAELARPGSYPDPDDTRAARPVTAAPPSAGAKAPPTRAPATQAVVAPGAPIVLQPGQAVWLVRGELVWLGPKGQAKPLSPGK